VTKKPSFEANSQTPNALQANSMDIRRGILRSKWAISGKQNWRKGFNPAFIYGA